MAVKIASWNVNSVKVRLPQLLAFLQERAARRAVPAGDQMPRPTDFPRLEIEALGYRVETIGQRAYNGVALLSKAPGRGTRFRPARR